MAADLVVYTIRRGKAKAIEGIIVLGSLARIHKFDENEKDGKGDAVPLAFHTARPQNPAHGDFLLMGTLVGAASHKKFKGRAVFVPKSIAGVNGFYYRGKPTALGTRGDGDWQATDDGTGHGRSRAKRKKSRRRK